MNSHCNPIGLYAWTQIELALESDRVVSSNWIPNEIMLNYMILFKLDQHWNLLEWYRWIQIDQPWSPTGYYHRIQIPLDRNWASLESVLDYIIGIKLNAHWNIIESYTPIQLELALTIMLNHNHCESLRIVHGETLRLRQNYVES